MTRPRYRGKAPMRPQIGMGVAGMHTGSHAAAIKNMSAESGFTEDQKQYLEGFIAGLANKRGILLPNVAPAAQLADATAASSHDPMAIHWEALDRVTAAGGKLVPEEIAKREK